MKYRNPLDSFMDVAVIVVIVVCFLSGCWYIFRLASASDEDRGSTQNARLMSATHRPDTQGIRGGGGDE